MANFSVLTKQKLKTIVADMESDKKKYCKNPDKDFCRRRKISFSDTLNFTLSLGKKCLDKEMLDFYSYSEKVPTTSAMIQSREKLAEHTMAELFLRFTNACKVTSLFQNYQLLAVDGSEFIYPENRKEQDCLIPGTRSEKGYNLVKLNAIYDVQSNIFLDAIIQKAHEVNEHAALIKMLQNLHCGKRVLLIGDRGYESYNTFAHIVENGWNFLIRGRQGKKGILSGLTLPDAEEYDLVFNLVICKKHSQKTKQTPNIYKRIRKNAHFDFFTDSQNEYPLTIRVVKVKVNEELTEILITNLMKEDLTVEQMKEIYHMRWGIETAFCRLKHSIGAIALHSKKAELIIQELYARLIMYNFCQTIIYHVALSQKTTRKYNYKINFNTASSICINLWQTHGIKAPPNVEMLILKYIQPIRPMRSFERKPHRKPTTSFQYRVS